MTLSKETIQAIKLILNPKAVFKDRVEANRKLKEIGIDSATITYISTGVIFQQNKKLYLIPYMYSAKKINLEYKRELNWNTIYLSYEFK